MSGPEYVLPYVLVNFKSLQTELLGPAPRLSSHLPPLPQPSRIFTYPH
jgi:hypothetical protein